MQVVRARDSDEASEDECVFECLVEAMSWPGKVRNLPDVQPRSPEFWPDPLLRLSLVLLDGQASFSVHGTGRDLLGQQLSSRTGAGAVSIGKADYVLAWNPLDDLDVASIPVESSPLSLMASTLIMGCRLVTDTEVRLPSISRDLSASTVGGEASRGLAVMAIQARGSVGPEIILLDVEAARVLQRLVAREEEFPLAINVFLVDVQGHLVALPRTARCRKEGVLWFD